MLTSILSEADWGKEAGGRTARYGVPEVSSIPHRDSSLTLIVIRKSYLAKWNFWRSSGISNLATGGLSTEILSFRNAVKSYQNDKAGPGSAKVSRASWSARLSS